MTDAPPHFDWVSSQTAPPERLAALDGRMAAWYSRPESRGEYQALNDVNDSHQPGTEADLVAGLLADRPASVLEVGCGSGRLYRRLVAAGYAGEYLGFEMSAEVIVANRAAMPAARWQVGSVYDLPAPAGGFDAAFAYFVLEHCVYPARALEALRSVVRPGGSVWLVFPDFVAGRLLPSQRGYLPPGQTARSLLRARRWAAALRALYFSRVRLPAALRAVARTAGPFPVNLSPACLDRPPVLVPDMDAVYIASKAEVEGWARQAGMAVRYPAGTIGHYRKIALMQLVRPAGG